MAYRIRQVWAVDVPTPGRGGRVNEDLATLMDEMKRLGPGMVLEIAAEGDRSPRAVKALVSRAARELGVSGPHWSANGRVYARPAAAPRRRR